MNPDLYQGLRDRFLVAQQRCKVEHEHAEADLFDLVPEPRQLIFRYYDPLEGAILIDGVPLKDWDLTHLHRHMVAGSVVRSLDGRGSAPVARVFKFLV